MRYIIFTVLIFCSFGRVQAQVISAPDGLKSVTALLERQKTAWNDGDIGGYMREYWNSDSLLFTSGGKIQTGWAATNEKYRKAYGSREKMGRLTFSDVDVKLLSENSAWVFGKWELRRKADNPKGVFTLILKKFDDGWKIIHDHTSSESDK